MPGRAWIPLASLLLPALVLGACGGADDGSAAVPSSRPPLTSPPAATTPTTTTPARTSPAPVGTVPAATTTAPSATTPVTSPGAAPATSPPATGGAPGGCPDAVGGFVRDVRVSGADCARARTVAQAWFAAVHDGASPAATVAAAGYDCTGRLAGERASVSCAGEAGGTIAFTASP